MYERETEEFFGSLQRYSWAYRNLIGQPKEWTPTAIPRSVTASGNVNPLDDLVLVDSTSGNVTMTLETAVGCDGRRHTFKKTVAGNSMIIASSDNIDGAASITRTDQYGVVIVESTGSTWATIAAFNALFSPFSLIDPNADRILFWDDSAGKLDWLSPGNSIAITTTTIDTIQDIRTSASPQFTGLTLTGDLSVQGNTTLGNASGDTLTVHPNAVTWSNSPSHTGTHTFSTGDVMVTRSSAGGNVNTQTQNSDNTNAASHAQHQIVAGGSSGGDPKTQWIINGVVTWSAGLDNSASDIWTLAASVTLGTTNVLTIDSSGNATLAGKIGLGGVTSSGNFGAPVLVAVGRSTAQTAAVASVSTFTVGASDGSFEVSANVNVTTSTTHNFTVTCAYTDEGNTARTLTLGFTQLSGATFLTAITNLTGAGPYESPVYHIRCKAATAITTATTGTFTAVTYNAEGIIKQVN